MLPAMQPRVLVHDVDPIAPSEAARAGASSAFASLPPARTMLVGVVSWGDGPALEPAPWTLDGVLSAAKDVGLQLVFESLGPHEPTLLHRWLRAHASARDEDRRPATLDIAGARRPRRIPRPWIGRHLCLVVPCVHLGRSRLGRSTTWAGPLTSAFETLALATRGVGGPRASGGPRREDGMRSLVGMHVAAQIFASTTIILDASWWAPLVVQTKSGASSIPAASHLVALDRCLVMGTTRPQERWSDRGPQVVDTWLGVRMGVGSGSMRLPGDVPQWAGPAASKRWPVPAAAGPRVGDGLGFGVASAGSALVTAMADKALQALWRVSDQRRPRPAALPPAVPGPLARHWHELGCADPGRHPTERTATGDSTRTP
jgi:hypothetical protein